MNMRLSEALRKRTISLENPCHRAAGSQTYGKVFISANQGVLTRLTFRGDSDPRDFVWRAVNRHKGDPRVQQVQFNRPYFVNQMCLNCEEALEGHPDHRPWRGPPEKFNRIQAASSQMYRAWRRRTERGRYGFMDHDAGNTQTRGTTWDRGRYRR